VSHHSARYCAGFGDRDADLIACVLMLQSRHISDCLHFAASAQNLAQMRDATRLLIGRVAFRSE
jgi:hypothetical protein